MMTTFHGRRGIVYYSQFKPNAPYAVADGIFVVPSDGQMVPMHGAASIWMSRSHFVTPTDWSDGIAWERFRDWLIFDCFVMMNGHGAVHYDDNRHFFEIIANPAGACDPRYAVDYSDVTGFLVGTHFARPSYLPSRTYSELYDAYRLLAPKVKSAIEWFVAQPPSPHRLDPLFGNYWGLLHIAILIEDVIGLPPNCEHPPEQCKVCGKVPQPHRKISRGAWLRQELLRRLQNPQLVEAYAKLIERAKRVRDGTSHGPLFDRSTHPDMRHGEVIAYDVGRTLADFDQDSNAVMALLVALREIARALLVDHAFGIKHFTEQPKLKSTLISSAGA